MAQALLFVTVKGLPVSVLFTKEGEKTMDLEEGVILTAFGVRAWYLTKFRGHRVRAVRVTPIPTILGRMAYSRRWVLVDQARLPAA